MRIVVCGSYGDLDYFLQILRSFQEKYGTSNVFPNKDHIERSKPCIYAHHVLKEETDETLIIRARLMQKYFAAIDDSDLVIVINEKAGQEHYGVGTIIEMGYAHARGKKIFFTREPTNSNILSLLKMCQQLEALCV